MLTPPPVSDVLRLADDLRSWGATEEQIAEKLGDIENPELDVFEENYHALQLYIACQTQWIRDPNGRREALNYVGVDVVINRLEIESSPDLFRRLQIIEIAAIKIFDRQANEQKP